MEFGHVKRDRPTILVLADRHVKTQAEILPRICESVCGNAQYGHSDGDFRLNTTGSFRVARMNLDKEYISLKLVELQHLSRMFYAIQNQLDTYTNAMSDVLSGVTVALSATAYIEPAPNASKNIMYPRLHEELKTALL